MSKDTTPTHKYRWLEAEHTDLDFWGIQSPLPWPAEKEEAIDPKREFPFAALFEGIRRLRADGTEWTKEWGAVKEFMERGEPLNSALETGDLKGALLQLDEMEALRPGTAYGSFNRAFILRTLGDAKGAMAAAVEATHRAPGIEYVWMGRGNQHAERGEKKEAIFCFRKALALLPNHMQAVEGLSQLGELAKFTLHHPDGSSSDQYFTPEEFDRFVEENAARSKPDSPQLRSLLKQFREKSDGRHALVVLDRMLEVPQPDTRLLRAWKADALRLDKRIPEARALLETLLEEDPFDAEAIYTLAWCDFDEGQTEEGWNGIYQASELDPNHQQAVQLRFQIGPDNKNPQLIEEICEWAEEINSWRGYWWASMQCSTRRDNEGALRWAEAAYRIAPEEREALFAYANCLNNMNEGEYTAALIHPKLPEIKGDFILKIIFAGAMKKLGLPQEAIRVLREVLTEESELTLEWRGNAQLFLDELEGLRAQAEVDPELHPHTGVLRRGIWIGSDKGPETDFIHAGMPVPEQRPLRMAPPPGFAGSTGSIAVYLHGTTAELEPLSLGWFRAHEIDYSETEPPMMTLHVTDKGKLEASAKQGARRLPVTWSLYRVPSMETESAPG
ncbi:MAG: tetratricopeptide repeat protein [Luteolibacter sp.]|uniref:tetratricopeptide repeat protein n=1 Tax=Luteolibacter sp. TaxID=1962973 RepID=UPI0032667F8C